MTERTGWITLHRAMLNHSLMEQLPAAWFRIWIFILLAANWKLGIWWNGKEEISIPPGSLVISLDKLASKTGSGVQQVRSALKYLEATRMITRETTHSYTTITVVNWSTYQDKEQADNTPSNTLDDKAITQRQHSDNTAVTTIEQCNKNNKEYTSNSGESDAVPPSRRKPAGIDPDIRSWFDADFWPIYPRHEARGPALSAAAKKATTTEKRSQYLARLTAQLPEYTRRKAESGQRVIPLAATWFNQDRDQDVLTLTLTSTRGRGQPDADYPEYKALAE